MHPWSPISIHSTRVGCTCVFGKTYGPSGIMHMIHSHTLYTLVIAGIDPLQVYPHARPLYWKERPMISTRHSGTLHTQIHFSFFDANML